MYLIIYDNVDVLITITSNLHIRRQKTFGKYFFTSSQIVNFPELSMITMDFVHQCIKWSFYKKKIATRHFHIIKLITGDKNNKLNNMLVSKTYKKHR